jgi:hypothetical protein
MQPFRPILSHGAFLPAAMQRRAPAGRQPKSHPRKTSFRMITNSDECHIETLFFYR